MTETETFQYPPELFSLLVDTIPLLSRSKKDLLLFFRGAGMTPTMMLDVEEAFAASPKDLNKYEMARSLLRILNEAGDRTLATRRELLRRVVEFEDFSRCWESDVMKAKGLVAEIQRVVNIKDSFTRMSQARDQEAQAAKAAREAQKTSELAALRTKRDRIAAAKTKLFSLFSATDPQKRGKDLETALNGLFAAYDVLVAEDFRRKGAADAGVVEQVDGVVDIKGELYLVEMKWWAEKISAQELSPHVSRLMMRAGVSGFFISSSDFTASAIELANDVLQHRVLVLCTLHELVNLLERDGDLIEFIERKVRAAKLNRLAYKPIL